MLRKPFQQVYEVEQIMSEAVMPNEYNNMEMHYLIKWKNLGHQFDTWQPISSLKTIQNYLAHWIQEKRKKEGRKKTTEKRENYKSIKKYLSSESFTSKKRIRNEKYADELLKKQKVWQRYLPKEQPKCINLDDDEDDREQELMNKNKSLINQVLYDDGNYRNRGVKGQDSQIFEEEEEICPQQQYKGGNCMEVEEEILEKPIQNRYFGSKENIPIKTETLPPKAIWQEPAKPVKPAKAPKEKKTEIFEEPQKECQFKVVGQIDMKKIVKIHRNFSIGGVKILEISMKNGKKHFVREDDIKKINPSKLLEYYQDEQIDF